MSERKSNLSIGSLLLVCMLMWAALPGFDANGAPAHARTTNLTTTDQEYVRNGAFNLELAGWSVRGATLAPEKGKEGAGLQLGNALTTFPDQHDYALHELHLPDQITAGNYRLDYRFEVGDSPVFQAFRVLIIPYGASGYEEPITTFTITSDNFPGIDWQTHSQSLGAEAVSRINEARTAGKRMFLYVDLLNHQRLAVIVDNVSVRLSGEMNVPDLDGVIAYVEYDANGKEAAIHHMSPNGSDSQLLWTHPGTQVEHCPMIGRIEWRPDAAEVAFIGNHEAIHSSFLCDVYAVPAHGGSARRITNPPSRAELATGNYPLGTVSGQIFNNSGLEAYQIAPMLVYVQGAAAPVEIAPPHPQEMTSFTVPNVADLGPGVNQYVVVIWSHSQVSTGSCVAGREFMAGAMADVQPGQTVDAGELTFTGQCHRFGVRDISWKRDGSEIGFIAHGNFAKRANVMGETLGRDLFTGGMPSSLAWSPVDDRLLYDGGGPDAWGIHLTQPDGGAGTRLIDDLAAREPAWLPDGSGFIYTLLNGNLLSYDLAAGQVVPLSDFFNEAAAHLSVSPDGRYIVFERQALIGTTVTDVGARDLWILDRQNPLRMWPLTIDGRSGKPDWSRQAPPSVTPTPTATLPPASTPTPTPTRLPDGIPEPSIYLPNVQR